MKLTYNRHVGWMSDGSITIQGLETLRIGGGVEELGEKLGCCCVPIQISADLHEEFPITRE